MTKPIRKSALRALAASAGIAAILATGAATAQDMPGEGITVTPLKSSLAGETFQTMLVMKALEELGYTVNDIKELEYATAYLAEDTC